MKNLFEKIVTKTESYLKDHGINNMVLGISGGIDSTVVAAICHEISKRNHDMKLIGISLPSVTNSEAEDNAANRVLRAFCDVQIQADISDIHHKVCMAITNNMPVTNKIASGNVKARLRMIYLYYFAGINNGVVMDTDNKTEHYLGFYTIHGDVGDLSPIASLWKTEVYALAKWIRDEYWATNKEKRDAMMSSIMLTPTDGNGVMEGGDLAQIMPGYTYADVDNVLKFAVSTHHDMASPETIEEFLKENPKITEEAFFKVWNRHLNTEYKRRQLPVRIQV